MSPPRAIPGNPGSRIRLVFGGDGSSWLLLLNEDNGNSKSQKQCWKSIPNKVVKQLSNCRNKGRRITQVDFGGRGSWFMSGRKPDGTGGHSWWDISGHCNNAIRDSVNSVETSKVSLGSNLNNESCVILHGPNKYHDVGDVNNNLVKRMKRMKDQNKAIKFVRLFDFGGGGFFISDDEGTEWSSNLGEHCCKALKRARDVHDVAVAGDGSWVIITAESFISSTGVDKELVQYLNRFYAEQREWKNKRDSEIQEHHERIARETREAEERIRAEREAAERAERERAEREAREREEREQAEREERERIEREERERSEREESRSKVVALESMLEEHLLQEALDIRKQEQQLRDNESWLRTRKGALRNSMDQLPEALRVRLEQHLKSFDRSTTPSTVTDTSSRSPDCVVCQDNQAVRAVIPCGHHCLCDSCAATLVSQPATDRMCPLCRATLQQTLRVYLNN